MIAAYAAAADDRASRRLVLWSLGFNLFFIGLIGALLLRLFVVPPPTPAPLDRSAKARIERMAESLPPADAELMRAEYRAKAGPVDVARAEFERNIDAVRTTFRAEPYDGNATRGAMTEARTAYQKFQALLQDIVASAAAKMSVAGRQKLADWSPSGMSAKK
jgi:uncharacterized membrane protein